MLKILQTNFPKNRKLRKLQSNLSKNGKMEKKL